MIPTEKILMMNSISNNGPSFPPGNPSSNSLKIDNLQDTQEQQVKKKLRLDEYIPVKHFFKPIVQTYNGKVRMWPTYDPDKSICDGRVEIYGRTRAGNLRIWYCNHDIERKNMKGVGLSFPDFLLVRYGEALDPDKNPRERSFDDYKWVFDLEIEQLADEYELGIGKKGHILEMIWENCKNIQGKAKEWWYDYWLEEDEKQENGDKKYDPPMVHLETFEVTRYSFDNGNSFICVTNEIKDTLSL
ncbi:hypothetical protein Tco_1198305 [Tanacetum coccineum]